MLRITVMVLLSAVLVPVAVQAQENQLRTWRAATGDYSVEARMIESKNDSVVLEKDDGERITVELSALSDADRKYVADQNVTTLKRKPPRNTGEMEYFEVEILKADREIPWKEIKPVSIPRVELGEPATFQIDGDLSFNPWATGLITDPSGSRLLFITGSFTEASGRVFDLVNGKPVGGEFGLAASCKPLALSHDSKSLIVVPARGGRGNVVWLTASSSGIREKLTWRYSTGPIAELSFATFIDDGRLLTADTVGVISLWDLDARSLLWQIESRRDCVPAVSHDYKTLVSCNEDFLFQVDLQTGEIAGCVPMQIGWPNCFGFSPTGDELVCVSAMSLRRIDATNGETREHWNVRGGSGTSIMGWVNDDQFLLKNRRSGSLGLIDLRLKGEAWSYQVRTVHASSVMDCQGRAWSLLRDVKDGVSYSIEGNTLPHRTVQQWCEQQDDADFVLLKPGDAIRLQLSAVVHDATQAQLDQMKRIAEAQAENEFGAQRQSRAAGGSPGFENMKSSSDRLAAAMKNVRLDTVDASDVGRDIVLKKLANSGLVVSTDASYTLHVEIGHPNQLTNLNQTPSGAAPKPSTLSPYTLPGQSTPLPYSLKLQAFLTDPNGDAVWKSGSQTYSLRDSGSSKLTTTGPEGVNYLHELDIPGMFVNLRPPGYSIILAGEIDDQEYK